jgi:hypothetical protein
VAFRQREEIRNLLIKVNSTVFFSNNSHLSVRNHTAEQNAAGSGAMTSRTAAPANWNSLKWAAAAAAMAMLAGCAIAVPLRPLTTASQETRDRDLACTAYSKCPNAITGHRHTSRRSQPVSGGSIAHEPPDFILNSEAGTR